MAARAIAIVGLICVLLSGCAITRTRAVRAADQLTQSADAFALQGAAGAVAAGNPGYLVEAREFANQTRYFQLTAANGSDLDVVYAFQQLWRRYHALRDAVIRSHDPSARADLKPVDRSFVRVQRIVKNAYSYADTTVYASGGYVLDPYYN